MKQLYHLCTTAHSEVLLRNIDDVRLMTNFMALSALRNDTMHIADSQMSTHKHEIILSEDPHRYAKAQMISITKAFNSKYGRKGPLFDSKAYILPIYGPRHIQMAMTYVLRQGLHHGQTETAFAYPWSTCNCLFQEERGCTPERPLFSGSNDLRQVLPRNNSYPEQWQADKNGILVRSSFEELTMAENWFGTARAYMYSMLRKSSEEWLQEQQQDTGDEPIITLDRLEEGYSAEEISEMLYFEGNPKYVTKPIKDMELCTLIDNNMLGRYGAHSVYQLSRKQKWAIADELKHDLGITNEKQLSRCLVLNYD